MSIRGVFFDFGFVIGFPTHPLDRKYYYLNWDGIDAMLNDPALNRFLRPGVGRAELDAFFEREIYTTFVEHEQADSIDPQSNQLLLSRLPQVFACPVDQALVDKLLVHLDTMPNFHIDPAAGQVIRELKRRGLQVGLVSNMMLPGTLLKSKLREAGLLDCFDTVAISSEVGFLKPHLHIFLQAARSCGLLPGEILFVGDTYRQDILGAKRAGLVTAWFNTRREPRSIALADPPDCEIESLAALLDLPILTG